MNYQIDHVIFDLGGVLLNIDLERIPKGFEQIFYSEKADAKFFKQQLVPAYETGQITTEEFLDNLIPLLKDGYSVKDIIEVWNSIILDLPTQRLDMLGELRENYKVHLLSNINDLHAKCFEEYFRSQFNDDPRNHFDSFFYSHHIGKRKPDVDTYTWVIDQLNTDPKQTVFIDDMPENIEGAQNAGINAYQLIPNQTDVIGLMSQLGLIQK